MSVQPLGRLQVSSQRGPEPFLPWMEGPHLIRVSDALILLEFRLRSMALSFAAIKQNIPWEHCSLVLLDL